MRVSSPDPAGFLAISHVPGERAPYFIFGKGHPCVCITAGLHGWETSAIATAWEFVYKLMQAHEQDHLQGRFCVIPMCNPRGTLAMVRDEPSTGQDLNRSFSTDREPPLASELASIQALISEADLHVDIHSGSRGTYLPHVIVADSRELEAARVFGLHFALVRRIEGNQGSSAVMYAKSCGTESYCLEVGGGYWLDWALLNEGCSALQSFSRHCGALTGCPVREATAAECLYPSDSRVLLRSVTGGIFYPCRYVGEAVSKGDTIGYRVNQASWTREPIEAPINGRLIYTRVFPRISEGETLAMLLPPLSVASRTNEQRALLM